MTVSCHDFWDVWQVTAKNPNLINKRFEEFDLHGPRMPAQYNVGPGQLLLVIATDQKPMGSDTGGGAISPSQVSVKTTVKSMKWGLVPFWDNSEKPKIAPINAKSEDVLTKRVFSQSLHSRRCLVPADGFYEWRKLSDKLKQPHHFQI